MKDLQNFFKIKQVKTVFDVGTGSGDFIKVLKKIFPLAKLTAVDPHIESLNAAKKSYPDVDFIQMKAEQLQFQKNSFDVASISMALHHLADVQKALNELQRVTNPSGWIIVSELFSDNLNGAQEVHKLYHHFKSKIDRMQGISHNETFRKDEILELIRTSGIEIIDNFEYKQRKNLLENSGELESRIESMHKMLDQVKDRAQYERLKPKIDLFKSRAEEFGFEPATRVIVIGKPGPNPDN